MTGIDATAIDALLPQTQCRRCGYAGCLPYAEALAAGTAELNRCPPGGARLIGELAALLGRAPLPLDPACGAEMPPRVAEIVAADCTGCARCLPACPVDAILGARRQLHTVLADWCTGCELCLPACPVDCIRMRARPEGGGAAQAPAAEANRARFVHHQRRRQASAAQRARLLAERKRAVVNPGGDPP
jgi:electron transport complex protein RnfB